MVNDSKHFVLQVSHVILIMSMPVPGKVRDLQCFSRVLIWQAPAEPNGLITDYELTYTRNGETEVLHTEGAQTFHLADSLPGDSGPFNVEVSA